ncbi:RluA family pseudouridine synthase [Galbibacter sp.]|uniref:RluA family pseudouridine synthase n=1 Tax=Galbibacter sp. TaxID=2918471 RepID=UPI003A933A7D
MEILYEDSYLAAIVKPAGVLVSGNKFKTITNALPHQLKKSDLADACLPQPVHRLDFGTSGILLCGKTQTSIRILNKMFEHKETSKTYYAITAGEMPDSGSISSLVDDKESLSHFNVIHKIPSEKYSGLNLVKLDPKTGRRHQLRKHLASIGYPILGDQEYGLDHISSRVKGLHLHSFSLRFIHPLTKKEIYLQAPIPKRFKKLFPAAEY